MFETIREGLAKLLLGLGLIFIAIGIKLHPETITLLVERIRRREES